MSTGRYDALLLAIEQTLNTHVLGEAHAAIIALQAEVARLQAQVARVRALAPSLGGEERWVLAALDGGGA